MPQSETALAPRARTKTQPNRERQGLEEFFSPGSLAERLECSVAKVRKSIRQGQLDVVRVGRLVRIPTSSVQKWLSLCRPAP
jgi:excisionase family DNA binding protein